MTRWLMLLCLLFLPAAHPRASASELPDESPSTLGQITVRLYNHAAVPPEALAEATDTARRILREAGVHVVWWTCAGATNMLSCEDSLLAADYRIVLLPKGAQKKMPVSSDGLGFVLNDPDRGVGRTAWVLCSRIEQYAAEKGFSRSHLLGYVVAHELGHLLLRSPEHPPNGLMRGHWQDKDLRLAARGALHFTRPEAQTIRAAARARPVEGTSLLALVIFVPR